MIRLLILDVDGVLTPGQLTYGAEGEITKTFHVHDGLGIKRLMRSGVRVAIISSRSHPAVTLRANELGITPCYQGCHDKWPVFQKLIGEMKLEPEHVAYMGDDLPDLPIMGHVGLAIAPANAVPRVQAIATWVTQMRGGEGAVREAAEALIKHNESI